MQEQEVCNVISFLYTFLYSQTNNKSMERQLRQVHFTLRQMTEVFAESEIHASFIPHPETPLFTE